MSKQEPSAEEIQRVLRHLSKLGASKGGKARARKLTPERRSEIARLAARARYEKKAASDDQKGD